MKVTVFQALTILAQKYKGDERYQEKYDQVKKLYLSGVRSAEDKELLTELLKDEALKSHEITAEAEDINRDPVRRYFESTLTHETLANSLDNLDKRRLERFFKSMFTRLSYGSQRDLAETVFSGDRRAIRRLGEGPSKEYAEAIRVLKRDDSFQSLKPEHGHGKKTPDDILKERKEKMELLAKCSRTAMVVVNKEQKKGMPLDLYGKKDYVYDSKNRGRKSKEDPVTGEGQFTSGKHALRHNALGIMTSYMPLSKDDPLYAKKRQEYFRPADASTYVEGAQMPTQNFATEVSPFVNSISGTMLIQLRMAAQLMREKKYIYEAKGKDADTIKQQLHEYFRNYISFMIYNAGGHSLNEFLSVLQLPEVQEEFKDLPGLSGLTLENLFKLDNETAFEQSVDKAIEYNSALLQKRQLHEELVEPKLDRELQEGEDELTVRARSRLVSLKERLGKETSLDRKNKAIDQAYNTYTDPEASTEAKENAEKVLIDKLNLKLNPGDTMVQSAILEQMDKRAEALNDRLFSRGRTLASRLDEAWDIYQNEERTLEDRTVAQNFMLFVLDIQVDDIPEDSNINEVLQQKMLERELVKGVNPEYIPGHLATYSIAHEDIGNLKPTSSSLEVRDHLFKVGKIEGARLDEAWQLYNNESVAPAEKAIARQFLLFVLDIKKVKGVSRDAVIAEKMEERQLMKERDPDFIPGETARKEITQKNVTQLFPERVSRIDRTLHTGDGLSPEGQRRLQKALDEKELLDINERSKKKDRGESSELRGKGTTFFNPEERDMFRILIRNGKFVDQSGKPIDTSKSISHGKEGFAAFTLNANGELSIFQHIDHNKTGMAHSSMNAGVPVVSAGEIRIKNGRITGITDHSGHYRPSAYNVYKALNYFRHRGVDIKGADVFMFRDPSGSLGIKSSRSQEYPHFTVCKAEDLCNSYKANFKDAVQDLQKDLAAYQSFSFKTMLYKIKDFFTGSDLTSKRLETARLASEKLVELSKEIEGLDTVEKMVEFSDKFNTFLHQVESANTSLSSKHGKSIEPGKGGRLSQVTEVYREKLNNLTEKTAKARAIKSSNEVSSDEDILSDSSTLKDIGRSRL